MLILSFPVQLLLLLVSILRIILSRPALLIFSQFFKVFSKIKNLNERYSDHSVGAK